MTHEFLYRNEDYTIERWRRYLRWANLFGKTDDIVTFNYDLVVERAFVNGNPSYALVRSGRHEQNADGKLHKLHGSVDWQVVGTTEDQCVAPVSDPFWAMMNQGYQPGIGIPGPGKMSASSNLFLPQWNCARAALRAADAIVIVGYSFPASDTFAKDELLSAIRDNDRRHLAIRLVLGPDRNSTIIRLDSMLRWVLRARTEGTQRGYLESMTTFGARPVHAGIPKTFELIDTHMYAEDFLTVFDRDAL